MMAWGAITPLSCFAPSSEDEVRPTSRAAAR